MKIVIKSAILAFRENHKFWWRYRNDFTDKYPFHYWWHFRQLFRSHRRRLVSKEATDRELKELVAQSWFGRRKFK